MTPAEEERAVRKARIVAALEADPQLVDRLFGVVAHGRAGSRTLEARVLMLTLEAADAPEAALSLLRRDGFVQLAHRVAARIGDVWGAWQDDTPGARADRRRVGKWSAIQRVTGLDAAAARTLWKAIQRQLRREG